MRDRVFFVEPDPGHPLAGGGISAAEVAIEAPETGPLRLALHSPDGAREVLDLRDPQPSWPDAIPVAARLTVIVPVYEDLEATRACLESLQRAQADFPARALVVDDASPNAELAAWLDARAADGGFELLRNPANLGFAASVNRALRARAGGDALLLNADAVLPAGALARLSALAHSAPDVGAVTPLSNNGELTSYPVRNAANPLPSPSEIDRLDALARAANGDALVDMPNGVGFCLYLTAACLEAVGPLPEIYAEGYYEDVEFCLRARELGFRNVAAPGVYVGHAGSRSFSTRKQALVVRNLALIEARFPGYRLETAAFVALDPLRPYRAALDAAWGPAHAERLAVYGPGDDAGDDDAALRLRFDAGGGADLVGAGGRAPQSLRFAPGDPGLAAYLARADIGRIAWRDPAAAPEAAVDALLALDIPIDVVCADLAAFAPPPAPPAGPCREPGARGPCAACRDLGPSAAEAERQRLRRPRLARVLERAERIVPLDPLAAGFAARVFKTRAAAFEGEPMPMRPRSDPIRVLGALYPRRAAIADRLLARLARRLGGGARLVVLGATLDDAALMACGAFVTGPVAPHEHADLARAHGVEGVFAPGRGGGYGDLAALAAALAAPMAFFDWSFGAFTAEPGDLSLDPRVCDDKAAAEIEAWMRGTPN